LWTFSFRAAALRLVMVPGALSVLEVELLQRLPQRKTGGDLMAVDVSDNSETEPLDDRIASRGEPGSLLLFVLGE
jgi:hypothetical protein